jgi:hypothetical protein
MVIVLIFWRSILELPYTILCNNIHLGWCVLTGHIHLCLPLFCNWCSSQEYISLLQILGCPSCLLHVDIRLPTELDWLTVSLATSCYRGNTMTVWGVLLSITSGRTYQWSNTWVFQSPTISFQGNPLHANNGYEHLYITWVLSWKCKEPWELISLL